MKASPSPACPCESGASYAQCCAPLHAGAAAPSAIALMRSRYSAYVQGRVDYLLASWHASTRPATLVLEPGTRWLGLSIKSQGASQVEFVARYREGGGSAQRLHERSRFVQEDGHWFYVDGEHPSN